MSLAEKGVRSRSSLIITNKHCQIRSGFFRANLIASNTIEYTKTITGTGKVHVVIGGFHLTCMIFDHMGTIQPTTYEMKRIELDYVVPMHCTGWKAINVFAKEMSE